MRRGLIHCLSYQQQIEKVLVIAQRHAVFNPRKEDPAVTQDKQLKAIENDVQRRRVYVEQGIDKDCYQPLTCDIDSLELDLKKKESYSVIKSVKTDPQGNQVIEFKDQSITLREATLKVIEVINEKLTEVKNANRSDLSLREKRRILLNTQQFGPLQTYDRLPKETEGPTWLSQILKAMQEKLLIFNITEQDGYGYWVQV